MVGPYPDMLSLKTNEFIPAFLVTHLKKRVEITDPKTSRSRLHIQNGYRRPRDSLAPKLIRYIDGTAQRSSAERPPPHHRLLMR